jgi:hypothetical protein
MSVALRENFQSLLAPSRQCRAGLGQEEVSLSRTRRLVIVVSMIFAIHSRQDLHRQGLTSPTLRS